MRLQLVDFFALVERIFAVSDGSELLFLVRAVNEYLFAVDQQDAGNVSVGEDPCRRRDVVLNEVFFHSLTLFRLLNRKESTVFGVILTSYMHLFSLAIELLKVPPM